MYSVLIFILIVIIASFFFQIIFTLLPYLIVGGLILWVLSKIVSFFSKNDEPQTYDSPHQTYNQSQNTNHDVIDVEFKEREIKE